MTNQEITCAVASLCDAARKGAPTLALATNEKRSAAIDAMADALLTAKEDILTANQNDLNNAAANGVPRVMMDRLLLTEERLVGIADAVRSLRAAKDPLAASEAWERPMGLSITRKRVPIGVVGIIYEARPNVTADAAALCVRSGNAVILRGGKEAIETNRAIVNAIKKALTALGISPDVVGLVEITDRESANALMQMRGGIDVLIPRGGKGLIQSCVMNAKVPVIETGAGNCHVFVDKAADLDMALRVAVNAKCQRPSVCNAAECLLLHRDIAERFLPAFHAATRKWSVELRGCPEACRILPEITPATEEDFATEYNDFIMSVKVVDGVEEATAHIARFGTKHSEAIITADDAAAKYFEEHVDAAVVYRNASTRFTDGGVFGFGAEIGISTQKLHARGPMGLDALTTVKYVVSGDGAIRE